MNTLKNNSIQLNNIVNAKNQTQNLKKLLKNKSKIKPQISPPITPYNTLLSRQCLDNA